MKTKSTSPTLTYAQVCSDVIKQGCTYRVPRYLFPEVLARVNYDNLQVGGYTIKDNHLANSFANHPAIGDVVEFSVWRSTGRVRVLNVPVSRLLPLATTRDTSGNRQHNDDATALQLLCAKN